MCAVGVQRAHTIQFYNHYQLLDSAQDLGGVADTPASYRLHACLPLHVA